MTPEHIDRVFGRGRLKMVTGEHVEVYREAVAPGERRRYTKRFLNTTHGDFAQWTEREWRILARLIGHGIRCVPDVVQFDRGGAAGMPLVQTYDAGVTVDQWATLLPVIRDGQMYRHVFEDCAHWWALAHHCLAALNEIHQLHLVHLDIKGDNVCIPFGPATFDPEGPELRLHPIFGELSLIDFAFALVSRESVTTPLPIGWQKDYDYQSPRLLKALEDGRNDDLRRTRELDWRCDIYSLAAMLKRYLPDEGAVREPARATGWTGERYDAAKSLLLTLRDWHDRDARETRPHADLIALTGARLREGDLARSLTSGWTLARHANVTAAGASPLTPMTRLAAPIRVFVSPRAPSPTHTRRVAPARRTGGAPLLMTRRDDVPAQQRRPRVRHVVLASAAMLAVGAAALPAFFPDATHSALEGARSLLDTASESGRRLVAANEPSRSAGVPAGETAAQQAPQAVPTPAISSPAAPSPAAPPAEERTAAASDSTPAAPLAAGESASTVAEPTPNREAGAGPAATDVPQGPSPEVAPSRSRTKSKAAALANDTSQRDKQAAANATPWAPPPSPKATAPANAKSPPIVANRSAAPWRGAPATVTGSRAGVAAGRRPEASRVDTASAPVQLMPAAPSGLSGSSVSPSPPEQQAVATLQPSPSTSAQASPTVPGALSTDAAADEARTPSAARESRSPATPDASGVRPKRTAPAGEKRAEVGLLAWLFQRAQRTLAPIEERRPPASGRKESVAAAPQAQVTSPPQDTVARAPQVTSPPQDTVARAPAGSDIPRPQTQTPPPLPPATLRASPPPALPESPVDTVALYRVRETEYALQARRVLAQAIPRSAARTQSEIARVLWTAANAYDPAQERAVSDAAQAVWTREEPTARASPGDAAEARRLNDEAIRAYWYRRNVPEAYDLQMKAFGANPYDPEVAGNLAFLHLRVNPAQAEVARQLALHAIAVRGSQYPAGRLEDWNTYAVASALTGRDADARNALFVTVALARNVERNCKAGQIAVASYGERVREPVNAMMYRIHTQGRAYASPYCQWPTNGSASARSQ